MNYFYTKYKYSNRIRLLRMVAVLAVAIVLFCVGRYKVFSNNENASLGFNVMSWSVLVVGAILVIIIGALEIYKQLDIGKLYPIIAVTLGLISIFLIPVFETPDEQDHFGSAYNQSNVYLDYGNPYEDNPYIEGFVPLRYMRNSDAAIGSVNVIAKASNTAYDAMFDNMGMVDDDGANKVVAVSYSSNTRAIIYYLPALGITMARIIGLGFGWEYFLGALLNMLFYVAMTTYAINKMPIGKRALFLVSLLPICLQQASSFSYDCGVIACIMVVVAQAFFLKYGDASTRRNWKWNIEIPIIRTTITELIMYILCAVLLSSVKSGVFLIVMLLPFVMCINKKWFSGRNKIVSIIAIVVIVIAVAAYLFLMGGLFKIVLFLNTVPNNVREIFGQTGVAPIEYMKDPARFFAIVGATLKENIGHYFAQVGGTSLGYNRIFIFKGIYIINLLMLLVSMVRYDSENDEYKLGNRIISFIIGIVPVMITFLAMLLYWTLPTDNVVMGFQGRYIIPTLVIIMLSVGRWKKIRIPNIDNLFALGATITGYMTCISVLAYM